MNSIHFTQPHSTPQSVSGRDAREPASNSNTLASRIRDVGSSAVRFVGRELPAVVGIGVAAASVAFAESLISATASRAGVGTSAIAGVLTGGTAGFIGGAALAAGTAVSAELRTNRIDSEAAYAAIAGAAVGTTLGVVVGAGYGAANSFIEHH
ncbi:hypothetical protein [Burkholderia lata]|uniref:hypothetical protein n=1 Tax=Burkholderia lata (strain ATCC 17760 / DSM 23089 / LMG 22485 / NCIMB 9086 / R18194 / 383) TaxID=482957 RepID=UPI00399A60C5